MFVLNLLLAFGWMSLTGRLDEINFLFGFVVSYGFLWLARNVIGQPTYFIRFQRAVVFVFFVIWELTLASWRVFVSELDQSRLRPGVVAIPLDVKSDAEITLFANLITLTPGTLSLDVSDDRSVLYVHALNVGDDVDSFIADTKSAFERRIAELFQ